MTHTWAWTLLNLYLVTSVCAILFDLYILFSAGWRDASQTRREERLRALLAQQLQRVERGAQPAPELQRELGRRLRHVNCLLAFCGVCSDAEAENGALFSRYIGASGTLFADLCRCYGRRDRMQRASCAWLLASCAHRIPTADAFLLACATERRSLYCRENALTALYRGGDAALVVQAITTLGRQDITHSAKLLTDGLLSFRGDRLRLCAMLWDVFPQLTPPLRVMVVDLMRLLGADYREALLPLLDDTGTDDELCFAILRYYGRCTYSPARARMLSLLSAERHGLWEYAAVAASALRNAPGEDAISGLLSALSHPNWYVRYNAAESLVSLDLPQEIYRTALEGDDPYARDMMRYMLGRKALIARHTAPEKGVLSHAGS